MYGSVYLSFPYPKGFMLFRDKGDIKPLWLGFALKKHIMKEVICGSEGLSVCGSFSHKRLGILQPSLEEPSPGHNQLGHPCESIVCCHEYTDTYGAEQKSFGKCHQPEVIDTR